MSNYRKNTPDGVRDYCDNDMVTKDYISNKLKKLYTDYGYSLIETPSFEYLDVFNDDKIQNQNVYTLTNRNGEILALRADMTKALSRVLSNKAYKRLCYVTNIFRYPRLYRGKLHEFTQAGIELMNGDKIKSDAEAIRLAIMSLKELKINKFSIHIGNSDFLKNILNKCKNIDLAMEAIRNSDGISLEKALSGSLEPDVLDIILELTSRVGKYELLKKIIEKFPNDPYLKRLSGIYELIKDQDEYINFDFSLLSYGTYYNGVTFQAFVKGIGHAVIDGGRYTEIINNKKISAVGFGIEINSLIDKVMIPTKTKKAIIAYKDDPVKAYEKSVELIKEGYIVTMSSADSLEEAEKEGKINGSDLVMFL